MGRAYGTYGRQQRYVEVLVGRSEGKRPNGKVRRGWNIILKFIFKK
jgi:hypothetical protein